MKNSALFLILLITFSSCNSSKTIVSTKTKISKTQSHPIKLALNPTLSTETGIMDLIAMDIAPIDLNIITDIPRVIETQANRLVDYAFAFDGVRYKRGGTTSEGMDCSGLVVTTFDSENIFLPRVSRDIALTGNSIDIKQVSKGDLLFFATRRNSRIISHVGIVTTAKDGFVEFIHASTSAGVIVSNMAEKYWNVAFIQARRVI